MGQSQVPLCPVLLFFILSHHVLLNAHTKNTWHNGTLRQSHYALFCLFFILSHHVNYQCTHKFVSQFGPFMYCEWILMKISTIKI